MKPVPERMVTGLENARQRATRSGLAIGRPRVILDHDRVSELRASGLSWREIARRLGAGVGTVRRAFKAGAAVREACQNPTAEEL